MVSLLLEVQCYGFSMTIILVLTNDLFVMQSFLIVSDPSIAKHILKDNSKAYSKVSWSFFLPDSICT